MRVLFEEIRFRTARKRELVDLTEEVRSIVGRWNVRDGILLVFAPHATASLVLNENEEGLVKDILELFERLIPEGAGYAHDRIDDNAHAHLRSSIAKPFVLIPVREGELVFGTWQRIFFIEHDGPRYERRVVVEYVGT